MSEDLRYDVLIVGAGPSGLSASIRLKQLAASQGLEISVCILEKGAEVGSHVLSGAVFEPRALDELWPSWKEDGAPLGTLAREESFRFLTSSSSFALPVPSHMKNHGNYIISLGNLCRWLGQKAESLGVEIYPGFSVSECLFDEFGHVHGVKTVDQGIGKDGVATSRHEPGVNIYGTYVMLGEGARGSLTETIIEKYDLRKGRQPQTYGLGLKEVWKIPQENHRPGFIGHTIGWPLDSKTYGGGFVYHWGDDLVSLGYVVGLDYQNPYLSPYEEFQRWKHHPDIAKFIKEGTRLSYGARALNEGGYQSIPHLTFPGGCLIGCGAGFLNVPKIKGSHLAMKSGMVAAEVVFESFQEKRPLQKGVLGQRIRHSWIGQELYQVRNIRPAFQKGLWAGLAYGALDTYILRGRAPWTFSHQNDHESLQLSTMVKKIDYPKPDGILSFDRLSSVYLSNTNHEENQPSHLKLKDGNIPVTHNLALYDGPEQRYCPAGVYEFLETPEGYKLQVNSQNCIHCKTCDIKDPLQNIQWTPPEGSGGPRYIDM
jgi:electron-transferring-flavoprotein dehydrogenase